MKFFNLILISFVELKSSPQWYKKIALWICGIDHTVANDAKVVPTRERTQVPDHESLKEKPTLKSITDCFAVFVACLSIFVMVFYR